MNLHKKILETALLAGQIMTESNAESYRVEDTMNRILTTSKTEYAAAVSFSTSLHATLDDPKFVNGSYTGIKRISIRSNNLKRISRVNTISRNYTGGRITVDQAYEKLINLRNSEDEYTALTESLAVVGLSAAFAVLFGGSWDEFIVTILTGILLALLYRVSDKYYINNGLSNIFQSFMITVAAYLFRTYVNSSLDADIVIVSTLMPMVPGTAITNSLRDIFREDYLAGGARAMEAFLEALTIALGAALGLAFLGGTIW